MECHVGRELVKYKQRTSIQNNRVYLQFRGPTPVHKMLFYSNREGDTFWIIIYISLMNYLQTTS